MLDLFPEMNTCKIASYIAFSTILFLLLMPATVKSQDTPPPSSSLSVSEMNIEQLMEIEVPIVYGASKYEQTVTEAPASVTIITAHEIKMYGHRNLAEILESVRSFSMTYDRNYNYAGIRGFNRPGDYNSKVLLLIDGIRLNDNVYDQAPLGNDFPLDIDLIERVEIIRGPSQSLYGSNAFFAVINVITRQGRALNGVEVSGEAGNFNTYKGRLSYGRKFKNGIEALMSGSFLDSQGRNLNFKEFDTPDQNNGWANGCDGERYGDAFLKLRYKDFTLEGAYGRRSKNIPTASFGAAFNSPLNKTIDAHTFLDLKYEHQIDSQFGVMARISYNSYKYDGNYLFTGNPSTILNIDYSRGSSFSSELQLTKELFQYHKLLLGAEVRHNFQQHQGNYDNGTTNVYLDDPRNSLSLGLSVQDEYTVLDNLVLHAGLRYDHFSTIGDTFNPRVALVYTPWGDSTIKLIYGRAFRAPNAYEMYYADGSTQIGNLHLKEETVSTYEVVLEQVLGEHLNATMTAFYNDMNNIISQSTLSDGMLQFNNVDSFTTRGMELELSGKWKNGLQGRASYSFQQARQGGTDATVPNSPQHLAKLNLILPLIDNNLFLGLEERYTSKSMTLNGSNTSDFFLTNLTLFNKNFLKNLEISFSIYNLFDKRYENPGTADLTQNTIIQDGRTFRLKVTYEF